MAIYIKLLAETRKRLNKLVKVYKQADPELKNSITQDYVISRALTELEGKKCRT